VAFQKWLSRSGFQPKGIEFGSSGIFQDHKKIADSPFGHTYLHRRKTTRNLIFAGVRSMEKYRVVGQIKANGLEPLFFWGVVQPTGWKKAAG